MDTVKTTMRYTEATVELLDTKGNVILSADHSTFNDMISKSWWVLDDGKAQLWLDGKCIGEFEAGEGEHERY